MLDGTDPFWFRQGNLLFASSACQKPHNMHLQHHAGAANSQQCSDQAYMVIGILQICDHDIVRHSNASCSGKDP